METKTTFRENALRVVAILGLLAILLLGAWGIIQIAFFISSLFNQAGGAASTATEQTVRETLTLSVPPSATPGTSVAVNWTHQGGSGAYSYTLSYSCASGLSFKAPVPTGATQTVACDTPFNYTQATTGMTLTPVYSGSANTNTTITVTATKLSTGAIVTTATQNLVITTAKKAAAKPATTYRTSPKASYVASGRTTNLYGYPDLAVSIVSAYSRGGNVTVQFVIENVGTNISPANWSFNAVLPINGSYNYPSGPQRALYPGDKISFTLDFSDYNYYNYGYNNGYTYGTCNQYGPCAVPGYSGGCGNYPCGYNPYNQYPYTPYPQNYAYNQNTNVTIQVDPYNQIAELNKYNNSATASYISY